MTKKWDRVLILGLLLAVVLSMAAGFDNECEAVREDVLRLHILANSDSEEDQALKLQVRDAILRETAEDFAKSESQIETMARAEELLPKMKAVAEEALARAGSADAVRVALVNMYFETREYDGTILPAGYYDAVRIELGAAEGHNWWCVLFPQLCIGTAAEGPELERIEKRILVAGSDCQCTDCSILCGGAGIPAFLCAGGVAGTPAVGREGNSNIII